jgi:hypothetical protein
MTEDEAEDLLKDFTELWFWISAQAREKGPQSRLKELTMLAREFYQEMQNYKSRV